MTSPTTTSQVITAPAKESGHWYRPDATLCELVPRKFKHVRGMADYPCAWCGKAIDKGTQHNVVGDLRLHIECHKAMLDIGSPFIYRPPTIGDCAEHSLVPSVTGVISPGIQPGLLRYIRESDIDAALTLPVIDGESLDGRKIRIRADADAHRDKAAEAGKAWHGVMEKWFGSKRKSPPTEAAECRAVVELDGALGNLNTRIVKCEHGVVMAGQCGGKIDALLDAPGILDYKSYDAKPGYNGAWKPWPLAGVQLAGYGLLMGYTPTALYLSVGIERSTGAVTVYRWHATERDGDRLGMVANFRLFDSRLTDWQIRNHWNERLGAKED